MPEFDPKAYIAANADAIKAAESGGFDPKAYLAKNTPKPSASVGESAMRGAAQGLTFGFADEITAMVGAAVDSIKGGRDFKQSYEGWRSAIRRADTKAKDDNPITYGAGAAAGAIGSLAMPGGALLNPVKYASKGARVGVAAAGGGLAGAGSSTADALKGDTGLLADIGTGAAIGGATQGALEVAGPLLKKAAESVPAKLKGMAERRAFKSAVGNQQKAWDEATSRGVVESRGRELLDEGVVTFGTTARKIADRAAVKAKETGKQIGALLAQIDDAGSAEAKVSGQSIAEKIAAYADEIEAPNNEALVENLRKQAAKFFEMGDLPLKEGSRIKSLYKWDPREVAAQPLGKQATNKVNRIISDELEAAVGRFKPAAAVESGQVAVSSAKTGTGPSLSIGSQADDIAKQVMQASKGEISEAEAAVLADAIKTEYAAARSSSTGAGGKDLKAQYEALKSRYGTMIAASKDAAKMANRFDKNRTASLSDHLTGMAGAGMFGPKGLLIGAVNNLARKRGSSAAAVGLDKLANMLGASTKFAERYAPILNQAAIKGSPALLSTHMTLLSSDPDYRAALESDQKRSAIDRRINGRQ